MSEYRNRAQRRVIWSVAIFIGFIGLIDLGNRGGGGRKVIPLVIAAGMIVTLVVTGRKGH